MAEPGGGGAEDLFTPVTSGRISSAIVDQVRSMIAGGELSPGDRLPSERELADQFGVSRVTVRDALRSLEAAGLLDIRVGATGGAFLRVPSNAVAARGMSDMLLMSALTPEQVAEARLMLESNTVLLAVHRATGEDVADLRAICRRSDESLASGAYDVRLSWEFHDRLARATRNPAIELITTSFRGPLSMAGARARESEATAQERTVREHSDLVDAIEARDAERARAVITAHLVRATELERDLTEIGLPSHLPAADMGGGTST